MFLILVTLSAIDAFAVDLAPASIYQVQDQLNAQLERWNIRLELLKDPRAPEPRPLAATWLSNSIAADGPVPSSTLTLDVTSGSLQARYELTLPKTHALVRLVRSGAPSQEIVSGLLGGIAVHSNLASFADATVIVDPDTSNAELIMESTPLPLETSELVSIEWPVLEGVLERKVVIASTYHLSIDSDQAPISQDAEHAVFVFSRQPPSLQFSVDTQEPAGTRTPTESQPPSLFERTRDALDRYAGNLATGLLGALPFALYLWIAHRRRARVASDPILNHEDGVRLLLVSHLGLFAVLAIGDIAFFIDHQWNGVSFSIDAFSGRARLSGGALALVLGAVVLVWPIVVRSAERQRLKGGSPGGPGRVAGVGVGVALALLLIPLVLISVQALSGDRLISPGYGTAILCVWGSFTVLLLLINWAFFLTRTDSILGALAVTCGFFGFAFVSTLSYQDQPLSKGVTGLLLALIAMVAVAYFARAAHLVILGRPLGSEPWYERWRPWLLLMLAVLAFPTQLFGPEAAIVSRVSLFDIYSILFTLDNLLRFALLAVVVVVLAESSGRMANRLDSDTRWLGVLLAATAFFPPTERFLIVPIPFLVGVPLAIWGLRLMRNPIDPLRRRGWGRVIDVSIEAAEAERDLRDLTDQQRSKFLSGETTRAEYLAAVDAQRSTIADLKRSVALDPRDPAASVLGAGLPVDVLVRTRTITALGAVFALPWMALYIRNAILRSGSGYGFFTLQFVTSIIGIVSVWVLYGFFFGFFYPYLRGRTGLQKGILFAGLVVLPRVMLTLFTAATGDESWGALGLWSIQLFAHCLLLGLVAGDFIVIRQAGRTLADLVALQHMKGIAAWGTTAAVAVGAAVTTLLASSLGSVVSAAASILVQSITGSSPSQ